MAASYPYSIAADDVPPKLSALIHDLADRLVRGNAPQHGILKEQLAASRLGRVDLTGAGLFAYFEHPKDTPKIVPANMAGGDLSFEVQGLDAPAGALLGVSEGLVEFVEVYTNGDIQWPDVPIISRFLYELPLPISA